MNTILQTLIHTEEEKYQMMYLILLGQAIQSLEKQDWYRAPYGGQNCVQETLFQAKVISANVSDNFFRSKGELFKNSIEILELKMNELEKASL